MEKHLPHDHGEHENIFHIQELLDNTDHFQIVADIFKQLDDTSRLRIFWLLCHCEECVVNIAAMLEMSSPAISHHLRPLKDNGLITSRREGKEVYYTAATTPQAQLLHQMIEQVMEIACPESTFISTPAASCCVSQSQAETKHAHTPHNEYQEEQLRIIHEIHEQLTLHIDKRWTVEELSRKYLMNPTTLKTLFKSVYGTSIAAHIKEHRMEKAAELLTKTTLSILEISHAVGYDSQSKFTAAFKDYYQILPRVYRRQKSD